MASTDGLADNSKETSESVDVPNETSGLVDVPHVDDVVKSLTEKTADQILLRLKDGFQFGDILGVIDDAVLASVHLSGFSREVKAAFAVEVVNRVIDGTDTPWLPDFIADPLMKLFIPRLVAWAMTAGC